VSDVEPEGGWRRRASDRQSRLERFILNVNPVLSAVFYVGFVTAAIFIAIIYSHAINQSVAKNSRDTNLKIIASQTDACRRSNKVRRAFNKHVSQTRTYALILRDQTHQTPAQKRAGSALLEQKPLPLLDCELIAERLRATLKDPRKLGD
jgi:hypothetical protein